jgi:hypothetical protein
MRPETFTLSQKELQRVSVIRTTGDDDGGRDVLCCSYQDGAMCFLPSWACLPLRAGSNGTSALTILLDISTNP